MPTLVAGFLTFLAVTLPDSLITQATNASQNVEEVRQNLSAIDSLGNAYLRHLEKHPEDTAQNPMHSKGLTPQEFCERIGIEIPQATLTTGNRKVFWGKTSTLADDASRGYFVAIITPDSDANLPELIVTIDQNKNRRELSYIVPLPDNSSVAFQLQR